MPMLVLPFEQAMAMVIRAIPARIVSTYFLESSLSNFSLNSGLSVDQSKEISTDQSNCMKRQPAVTEVSLDWPKFFSTDQSNPVGVMTGLSIEWSKLFLGQERFGRMRAGNDEFGWGTDWIVA